MTWTTEALYDRLAPRPIQYFDRVDSTNDVAAEWIRDGAEAGAAVIADEQLKGRGRKGRLWHTPPGVALAVSVVVKPQSLYLHRVPMLGAVAIAELCEQVGLTQVGIKWPNDVQIAGRKVCGVLPEAVWDGQTLLGVVLGMGVNISVDFVGSPLENTATSIQFALGQPVNRIDLLVYLLERVDYWAARLGTYQLFNTWKSRLTTIGQRVTVQTEPEVINGSAESVDAQGALIIRLDDGTQQRVIAGDIALGE